MKFFTYDNDNELVTLNKPEILLVKQFAALMDIQRNICQDDPSGQNKLRAFREFTYIYLFFDWESPFFNEPEYDRHMISLDNAGLSEEEFTDEAFKDACNEYNRIQNSSLAIRLLKSAMKSVETVIYYLDHVDVNERNPLDGKPIYKTKDLIAEIKGCKDLIVGLQDLTTQVKKELEPDSGLRGGAESGFFDQY